MSTDIALLKNTQQGIQKIRESPPRLDAAKKTIFRMNKPYTLMLKPKQLRSNKSLLQKFRHFIETSEWDDKILKHQKWFDGLCWTILISSAVFFGCISIHLMWHM
jgi:hypothetical protein